MFLYSCTSLPVKVLLYETGVAEMVHLPPVGFKGHRLHRPWVHKVPDKVAEGGIHACCKRLLHCFGWIRLVTIQVQNRPAKVLVKVFIGVQKLVSVGREEADEGVPHKQELAVVLQFYLKSKRVTPSVRKMDGFLWAELRAE